MLNQDLFNEIVLHISPCNIRHEVTSKVFVRCRLSIKINKGTKFVTFSFNRRSKLVNYSKSWKDD